MEPVAAGVAAEKHLGCLSNFSFWSFLASQGLTPASTWLSVARQKALSCPGGNASTKEVKKHEFPVLK